MDDGKLKISCPLQRGDRISHSQFGFGIIVKEPSIYCGAVLGPPYVQEQGWRLTIHWDEHDTEISEISYFAFADNKYIKKEESVDAKGIHYWKNEWDRLISEIQEKSKEFDDSLHKSFRFSEDDFVKLQQKFTNMHKAQQDLMNFLEDQKKGLHV